MGQHNATLSPLFIPELNNPLAILFAIILTSLYEISLPEKYKAGSLGLVLALYSKVAARFNISTPKLYLKIV